MAPWVVRDGGGEHEGMEVKGEAVRSRKVK